MRSLIKQKSNTSTTCAGMWGKNRKLYVSFARDCRLHVKTINKKVKSHMIYI